MDNTTGTGGLRTLDPLQIHTSLPPCYKILAAPLAYALAEFLFIEILAGDVSFVDLFRSILPVVPTECDVLIVCRQHNDKEWKFDEQLAKNVGK